MDGRLDEVRAGPGFAPAMDERDQGVWRGLAIGCGALAMLGFVAAVSLIVVLMVFLSGLGQGLPPEPAEPAPVPSGGEIGSGGDEVVVRVTGTDGLRFSGDVGTLDETRSVAGTVPAEYRVRVDPGAAFPDSARAYLSRDYADETSGRLRVELVHDGEVVRESGTTAPSGNVSASWAPGDSPEKEVVTVRVSGTEGLEVLGSVGSSGESRSVAGTVPEEYEIRLDAGDEYDSARVYLSRDYADESPGTVRVEMLHEGEVVRRSETSGGGGGSVSLNWSPEGY